MTKRNEHDLEHSEYMKEAYTKALSLYYGGQIDCETFSKIDRIYKRFLNAQKEIENETYKN